MGTYENIKNLEFTLVGKECQMKGDFEFNGHTRIAGKLEGKVNLADSAILSIEPTGSIEGEIHCQNLEIYGHFDGSIHSSGKVTIYPPAKVYGSLKSKNLEVYPGALLNLEGFTDSSDLSD